MTIALDGTTVATLMKPNVVSITSRTLVAEAIRTLLSQNVTMAAVVDDGKLLGLVSLGDLMAHTLPAESEDAYFDEFSGE